MRGKTTPIDEYLARVGEFADEPEGFDASEGTIRFRPDRPLPVAVVKELIRAPIAENAGRGRR